jgi:PD-(D/E)XK nuclease superfamily
MGEVIKRLKPFTRWSYSAWSAFKTCRYMFGKGYYEGVRGPQGPAAARGEHIHKLSEGLLRGDITGGVPKPLKRLEQHYKAFIPYAKGRLVVEEFWGVTEKWKKAGKDDTWCVMKMDAATTPTKKDPVLTLVDLKTGREYPGHQDQGELYAVIGHALYPKIEEAHAEFWYADYTTDKPVSSWTYSREQLEELRKVWHERGRQMFSETEFQKTPSQDGCKWCHLRSDKGGPCSAWRNV